MSSNNVVGDNPAVIVAQRNDADSTGVITLSTGIRARIKSVSPALIQDVSRLIKDPTVPMWHNPDKDRDEPNPLVPGYVKALTEAREERGSKATDTLIMFGLDLVDPVPDDNTWLEQLNYIGIKVDPDNVFERDLAYKKYIACGNQDLIEITRRSGISQEAVAEAIESFRGDTERNANS